MGQYVIIKIHANAHAQRQTEKHALDTFESGRAAAEDDK